MFLFWIYFISFLYLIYRYSSVFYINKWISSLVFILKGLFVFLISYTSLKELSILNVPDEDNYFHDALMFNALAREYPMYYCQFWLDIEPESREVFNKYFTTTNAWYKAPEFFYNDNRWVIKIHSLLVFLSDGDLGVHRLFSVVFAIIGWMLFFKFVVELYYKMGEERVIQPSFYYFFKLREGCGGCGERSEPQYCPEERSDERITEAEAKPEAARPSPVKYSNYFTGEGHALIK